MSEEHKWPEPITRLEKENQNKIEAGAFHMKMFVTPEIASRLPELSDQQFNTLMILFEATFRDGFHLCATIAEEH